MGSAVRKKKIDEDEDLLGLESNLFEEPEKKDNRVWLTFITKNKKQRITARGELYWVVKDKDGRLWYKVATGAYVLPTSWKEGDPLPQAAWNVK